MRYIIFVIDQQTHTAGSDEAAAIDAFNESLEAGGHWITAGGIAGPTKATLIDNRADAGAISAASLFDAADFYSGFWIVEAEDDDKALELALAGSKACNRRVEVRPFLR
jgi:hypothetical protein